MNGFYRLEEEFDREVSPSCLFFREKSWGEQGYRAGGGGGGGGCLFFSFSFFFFFIFFGDLFANRFLFVEKYLLAGAHAVGIQLKIRF